jgi:hypothetical protein
MPVHDALKVFETQDFVVHVEDYDSEHVPEQRRRCYIVRHKTHRVAHCITNLFGEAVLMAATLQKSTAAVLADPENPDLAGALRGSNGVGLN